MVVSRARKHSARSEEEVVDRHHRDELWWLAKPESMQKDVSKRW